MNHNTIDLLKAMRFSAMAREFEAQLNDPSVYQKLGFEERLSLLIDAEWNNRQNNKLVRYIKNAHFSIPSATIEEIEYIPERKLDKAQILRFATCQYIDEGHHIVLQGAAGGGKTYIACALGNAACRKFKMVRYIRMPELLDELSLAQASGEFKKVVNSYRKFDLLILDEWLIRCLTAQESYNLLEVVETRSYGNNTDSAGRSVIFCSQYDTGDWYDRITPSSDDKSPIAEGIIDRIVNNAHPVVVESQKSMRKLHGLVE